MWAQLITARLKSGREEDVSKLLAQLRAAEQPGSGLLRSTTMRDQNEPSRLSILVVFESEEKARAREKDERRQVGLTAARATMAEIFDGPPEFTDLTVDKADFGYQLFAFVEQDDGSVDPDYDGATSAKFNVGL